MKKIIIKMFLILQVLMPLAIYSQEFTVTDIEINTLKKTRFSTVLKIIDLNKGSIVTKEITDSIKQDLLEAGIFQNDISVTLVELSESEAKIIIELKERWTIIPIPVAFVSSDSWFAGGVFIESNLLGLNQTLVSGLFASDENIQGFAAWVNPTLFNSDYSFGIGTSFFNGENEYLDITGENILNSFDEKHISGSLSLGRDYPIGFGWDISTGLEFFSNDQEDGNVIFKNEASISWEDLYYKGFFNEGWSTNLKTSILSVSGDIFNPYINFKISKNTIFSDKNLLKLLINTSWSDALDYKPILIGGTEGNRVLATGSVAVKKYADALISFEPVILNPSWGIFTLPIYYEAGVLNSVESDINYWHGPGIGFRFYVDKVAIPALGADFTWDFNNNLFKVAVSIGGTGGGN